MSCEVIQLSNSLNHSGPYIDSDDNLYIMSITQQIAPTGRGCYLLEILLNVSAWLAYILIVILLFDEWKEK